MSQKIFLDYPGSPAYKKNIEIILSHLWRCMKTIESHNAPFINIITLKSSEETITFYDSMQVITYTIL